MKAIYFTLSLTIMEKCNSRHIHTESIGEPHQFWVFGKCSALQAWLPYIYLWEVTLYSR